ncbi:MAG: arginine--tRNA ligase [Coprococcus catus]|jgi:arginyl-tRNA synthetase|uniref:Arginine--tRNA ligase n=1 Tax=Coprococcus intestinihominis TaxID=3133154 RepID=A0ABV1B639_9FIRM|nr:arginine--tRNA ligase [Coprococcus catus]MDD6342437.1 arginine--tRNA ligase [Coprococcus catus]MDY5988067.1 arginine--tRNA ligase [Coprococcus catus]
MKNQIVNLLSQNIEVLTSEEISQLIEIPPKPEMGDFAFPCFRLAKSYHKAPPMIAQDLKESIGDQTFLSEIKVVGGYLNFYVDKAQYAQQIIDKYNNATDYGCSDQGKDKTICIDYSSPNVAKNFHVGHLRTTIIGNSLYKIFSKLGYKVVRINHLGDWGTQFGKLIVAYKKWGSREAVEEKGIEELMDIYVKFHEEAEKDDSLNDEARAWFLKMEQGDEEALEIWQWFRDISLKEFMRVYNILGMEFDSFAGESFYRDKTADVIKRLTDDGLLKESQGAMIVPLDEYDMPPCIVAKKDGSSIYATRDLAAILYRKATYNFDRCLYVTGLEQKLHFAQVFKVIELMGNDYAKNLVHIPYGLVSLKSGKISSRKGNVIFAEDLLRESINKTTSIIEEKNPDIPDKEEVAKQVGIGAIIFNDLYNQRIKDVIFDWNKLLNFDGETGPYVQYTYARASSVLRKIGEVPDTIDYTLLTDEASIGLLKEIERYPQVIKDAAERYEPSVIARYSIDLAHAFNKFYHECQINVEDETTKYTRTNVVKIARYIIKDALSLLGIQCPEQM